MTISNLNALRVTAWIYDQPPVWPQPSISKDNKWFVNNNKLATDLKHISTLMELYRYYEY